MQLTRWVPLVEETKAKMPPTKRTLIPFLGGLALLAGGAFLVTTASDDFLRRSLGLLFLLGSVFLVKAAVQERRRSLLPLDSIRSEEKHR